MWSLLLSFTFISINSLWINIWYCCSKSLLFENKNMARITGAWYTPYQVIIKHDDQVYYLSPERSVKDKQEAYKPYLQTPDTKKNPCITMHGELRCTVSLLTLIVFVCNIMWLGAYFILFCNKENSMLNLHVEIWLITLH